MDNPLFNTSDKAFNHNTTKGQGNIKHNHNVNELYDRKGNPVDCIQRDTIQRIFELYQEQVDEQKQTNNDLILIKDALGIKEYQNGDRDKQIQEAKDRINEVGLRAEQADKNIYEKIDSLRNTIITILIALFTVIGILVAVIRI